MKFSEVRIKRTIAVLKSLHGGGAAVRKAISDPDGIAPDKVENEISDEEALRISSRIRRSVASGRHLQPRPIDQAPPVSSGITRQSRRLAQRAKIKR